MTDPNMADFYNRVSRIQRDHSRGYSMNSDGVSGRIQNYEAPTKTRIPVVGPILLVLFCAIGMKAMLHAKIGEAAYEERLATLSTGEGVDRVGATLMSADPLTVFLSAQLDKIGF